MIRYLTAFLALATSAVAGTFFNDTFTDTNGTNLTLHVGETGGAWNIPNANKSTLGSGSAVIASNRLRGNSTSSTTYLASGFPSNRAQTITAIFRCVTVAGNSPWVMMRMDTAGTNGYRVGYDIPSLSWLFQYNNVGGGWTTAVISVPATLTPGTDHTVVWTIDAAGGTNDNVTVTIDGGTPQTTVAGIVNVAGCPGVMFDAAATASTDSTGIHIASVSGTEAAASPSFAADWGFVMVGDSLSTDFGLPSTSTIPQLISVAARLNTDRYWNAAWPGQTLDDQASLYSAQVAPLYPLTSGKNNRIGIVFSGTNNLAANESAATILTKMKTEHSLLQGTGYRTVAVTLPPSAAYDSNMNTQRLALNASMRADHSWANFFSDLATNPDLSDPNSAVYFQTDHIHYTVAGRLSAAIWIYGDMGFIAISTANITILHVGWIEPFKGWARREEDEVMVA